MPAIELVAVTIHEIGVTSVVPRGWTETPDGGFADENAELGCGAIPSREAPNFVEEGFELIERLQIGGRAWDMYTLETVGLTVVLAITEIGATTYVVGLETPPHLADQYAGAVGIPALEAFKVSEDSISLAGTPPDGSELATLLDDLIAGTKLPAVGVTVFDGNQIIETAVAGVRRRGDPTLVELTDKFSIGSNAKAMTATLVATFVDEGLISWETTVAEVYADVFPGPRRHSGAGHLPAATEPHIRS